MSTAKPSIAPDTLVAAELLNVGTVARLLNCSKRTVYRLSDRGALPPPVRLGALVRWRKSELMRWLASGCPSLPRR